MSRIRLLGILSVLLVSVGLGACRDSEQDRVVNFEPGVYKGKKEAALSKEALTALRVRAMEQARGFSQIGGGSGGSQPSKSADVRPPVAGGIDADMLRSRMRGQGN